VRLGVLVRGAESLASDGLNKRAFWSSSRRMLAVVVPSDCLLIDTVARLCKTCWQLLGGHSTHGVRSFWQWFCLTAHASIRKAVRLSDTTT